MRSLKIKIEVRYNEWVQPSVVSDTRGLFPSGLLSYGLLSVAFCPVAFCTVAFCRGPLFSSERIFENPLRIDKVIAMSWVYYIFGTQCILYVYAYIVCWWTD